MSTDDKKIAASATLGILKRQEETLRRLLIANLVTAVSAVIVALGTLYAGYTYLRVTYAMSSAVAKMDERMRTMPDFGPPVKPGGFGGLNRTR